MMKKVMLTIFACCATILFVGCENGNIKINDSISERYENVISSGEEYISISRK